MTQLKINNGVVLDYTQDGWTEFKKWLDGTYAALTYAWVDEGLAYQIAAVDGAICRTFSINKADAGEFEAGYKTQAPTTQSVHLDCPESDGAPIMAQVKPDRPKLTKISHDFCDTTTWYSTAVRVADEVPTDSGDHQHYTLAHVPVDVYHGKITFEDLLRDASGYSYRVQVKVDGVIKSEQDPHSASGGDFTVNYADKTIAFLTPLAGTETVQVTYHKVVNSIYKFGAVPGKKLIIDHVEVQFSDDCVLTDTFIFQAHGPVNLCAPQLMASATIPVVGIDQLNSRVYLPTDVRMTLMAGVFAIVGSTGNDGTYHITGVDYDGGLTWIKTAESLPSAVADGYVQTVGLPTGTMIPLTDPLVYKSFLDLLADSNNSYPQYPAFGGGGWRSLTRPSYLFTWTYEVGSTILNGNLGMEVWVWMEHHQPCGGAFGIASVYCTSEDIHT